MNSPRPIQRPPTSWTAIGKLVGEDKILDLPALADQIRRERARGRVIVFTNGCFDVLHVGHARCLEGAKALGDILVVGVNSDASTRRLKGPGKPILPQRDRALLVAALRAVDYVALFDGDQPLDLLLALKPDIHAKGTDYTAESVPERDVVLGYGGRVAITGDPKRPGSRGIVATILERYAEQNPANGQPLSGG